jgi:hypothetical protein
MNPRVAHVTVNDGYTLTLTFTSGEVRVFDVKPYLEKGIFRELKDPERFRTAMVCLGTVQWKNGQDFCPDTLYEESLAIQAAQSLSQRTEKV